MTNYIRRKYAWGILLTISWCTLSFGQSEAEVTVDTIQIDLKVVEKTPYSTISSFSVDEGEIKGFFMERESGSDIQERTSGSRKRIPPGTYQVVLNDCYEYYTKYNRRPRGNCSNEFRLVTQGVESAGTRVGILVHTGNYPWHSVGCLLPGYAYETTVKAKRKVFSRISFKEEEEEVTTDIIKGSSCKLNELNAYIKGKIKKGKGNKIFINIKRDFQEELTD